MSLEGIKTWASEHPYPMMVFAGLSLAIVIGHAVSLFSVLLDTFILSGKSLTKFGSKRGAFAVVTGATDGIGREFALQLAKAGFGVVLVSRNQEKLDAVANEITTTYGVPTKTQVIDFARSDQLGAFKALENQLADIEIGVLVNNVGRSHNMPVYFAEASEEEIRDIVQVNVNGTLEITRIVLPLMLAKKNGLILNIGSVTGAIPSPMLATYSGSKAFLATWSQALADENQKKGITIQHINAFYVVSNMSKIRSPSASTPTAKVWVNSVLSRIGLSCGSNGRPYSSTPYWAHSIMDYFVGTFVPIDTAMTFTHRLHAIIRLRALRKQQRLAKQE